MMKSAEGLIGATRFLAQRYGGRAGAVTALGEGAWSTAYAFELDGRDAVLRLGAYGEDFAKDAAMARHRTSDLPIPRVLEFGSTEHGHFAVSERIAGEMLDGLDEAGMRRVLPDLLRVLDQIAAIEVSDTSGYGLWSPDGKAPRATWAEALLEVAEPNERLPGWRDILDKSPADAGVFDQGLRLLRELTQAIAPARHIIHSDLLNNNVLVQGESVTGVIDWGNALYGDHLYDTAWLIYWWPWYPAWQRIDVRAELARHWEILGRQIDQPAERLRCYQLQIGLDAIRYNAFRHNWEHLRGNVAEVRDLL